MIKTHASMQTYRLPPQYKTISIRRYSNWLGRSMSEKTFSAIKRKTVQSLLLSPLGLAVNAHAAWPEKPIRLVVPSAAGGAPDVICRILAGELAKVTGTAVVVDNKPGAGGAIGMQEVTRANPDAYTLGYANVATLAINQSLYSKLAYDADRQLAPVALLGFVQNVLLVNNTAPINSVKDLIALAKTRPGKLTMASAGNGTTSHLGGELFKTLTGTFITHLPYRGSPQALQDLMGGQVDLMFDNISSALPHIRAGRLRALAVSGARRSAVLPDIPTVVQAGVPGYETTAWGGIVAPAGTNRDLIDRLNADINKVLATPSVADRFAQLAFETTIGPATRLFELAQKERPMWADVIKRSGAKVD
jgi:tripartite-type tricarboxylate transporter receptor subunit TctC